jgi:hypothetical protein
MKTAYDSKNLHSSAFVAAYKDGEHHEAMISWLLMDCERGDIWIDPEVHPACIEAVIDGDGYYGRILRWTIPPDTDAAALEQELMDEQSVLRGLFERIYDGIMIDEHDTGWWTSESEKAASEVGHILCGVSDCYVLPRSKWVWGRGGVVYGSVAVQDAVDEAIEEEMQRRFCKP